MRGSSLPHLSFIFSLYLSIILSFISPSFSLSLSLHFIFLCVCVCVFVCVCVCVCAHGGGGLIEVTPLENMFANLQTFSGCVLPMSHESNTSWRLRDSVFGLALFGL